LLDITKRQGYFTSAMMNANTIIITGIDYMDYPLTLFRITVRTSGTIKPGTYTSESGDVSFYSTLPPGTSLFGPYIVDDSIGNLT